MEVTKIQPFTISINFDSKTHKIKVDQTHVSNSAEIFAVYGKTRTIEIQTNRPLVRGMSLNKKKYICKANNTGVMYQSLGENIIEAIRDHIKLLENATDIIGAEKLNDINRCHHKPAIATMIAPMIILGRIRSFHIYCNA